MSPQWAKFPILVEVKRESREGVPAKEAHDALDGNPMHVSALKKNGKPSFGASELERKLSMTILHKCSLNLCRHSRHL